MSRPVKKSEWLEALDVAVNTTCATGDVVSGEYAGQDVCKVGDLAGFHGGVTQLGALAIAERGWEEYLETFEVEDPDNWSHPMRGSL